MPATDIELNEARSQIHFFSNAGKKEREKWVIDKWCRLTGRECYLIVEAEGPDLTVGPEKVEMAEVMRPDRKRQDECKDPNPHVRILTHGKIRT